MAGERKPSCPNCGGRLRAFQSFGDRYAWACRDCKGEGIAEVPSPSQQSEVRS